MAFEGEIKREWQREYNRVNRAKINEASKVWKKNNPEKVKEIQRRCDLKIKYGVSLEEYRLLLEEQNNCCALCGIPQEDAGRTFGVDHNHTTGAVRGLLCSNCNTGIGLFDDSLDKLEKAIRYLKKYESN